MIMKKVSIILLSAGILGINILCQAAESPKTESDIKGWNKNAGLIKDDVKVGKCAVKSGVIIGNHPTFTLFLFPEKLDFSSSTATISLHLKVNTTAPKWKPEIRIYSQGANGFCYWPPAGAYVKGNLSWRKFTFKVKDMPQYKTVDLTKINKIIIYGYKIIAKDQKSLQSEFFIDGLTFKEK